jgi:hypothetical protein
MVWMQAELVGPAAVAQAELVGPAAVAQAELVGPAAVAQAEPAEAQVLPAQVDLLVAQGLVVLQALQAAVELPVLLERVAAVVVGPVEAAELAVAAELA